MRVQLGNAFNFTRSVTAPSGAYCNTRIDRHYLPHIPHHVWESEITPLLIVESDHVAVKSTLTDTRHGLSEVKYGNDVITINARVLDNDQNRAHLQHTIDEFVNRAESCILTQIPTVIDKMQRKVLEQMRRMTISHAKSTNKNFEKINKLMIPLHESQARNLKPDYDARKAELTDPKKQLIISLSTPKPLPSYYKTLGGKTTTATFWRRVFPLSKDRRGIQKINKVDNWSNPIPKNTSTRESTQDIAQEAARYYEHLYSP
eukprot:6212938-Pleurochrysis_carterae.AAC.6